MSPEVRRAYICTNDKCKPPHRVFIGPHDPVPRCSEHGKMAEQANSCTTGKRGGAKQS